MKVRDTEISRAMSHALRHEPWLYELELDDEGWASVDSLILALHRSAPEWVGLSRSDIEGMIARSEKQRHELAGDRVRALYGHSLPGKLKRQPAEPPAALFHGTSMAWAEEILRDGLKPMRRQYVHLSVDEETARQVGRRKGESPVLLSVDAAAAHREGVVFYTGNEKVWLADSAPSRFISRG